jgi:hypothetical protein
MSKQSKQELMERVASWPDEDLEKLDDAMRAIEAWRTGEYYATEDELSEIDAGLAELDRGEVATEEQVRKVLPHFRA